MTEETKRSAPPLWLVAHDLSADADAALEEAARELVARQGRIVLVHALELLPTPVTLTPLGASPSVATWQEAHAAASKDVSARLEDKARRVERVFPGVRCEARVVDGHPAEVILRVAAEIGAARIVVGTRGRTGLRRALLGSVAERVVRLATVPVLVVRQADPGGDAA